MRRLGRVEQVAAKVVPSVVMLETNLGRQSEEGSGIILSADGLILTNNHVVATAANPGKAPAPREQRRLTTRRRPRRSRSPTRLLAGGKPKTTVTFSDGRTAEFTVVGADPTTDIAVVRVQGVSGLTPISLGSSANLRVGQPVMAVGSPLGLEGTVTTGIVSALNRPVSTTGETGNQNTVLDAIQTDAAINPGNSGGALVNMSGQLVGVNSAIATLGGDSPDAQSGSIGLGFAIPVDQAKRIADELISSGTAAHASLGVQVTNDKGDTRRQGRRGRAQRCGGGRRHARRRRGHQGRRPHRQQRRRAGRCGAIQGTWRQSDADVQGSVRGHPEGPGHVG